MMLPVQERGHTKVLVFPSYTEETSSGTIKERTTTFTWYQGQNLSGYNPFAPNVSFRNRTSYHLNQPGNRDSRLPTRKPVPLCASFPRGNRGERACPSGRRSASLTVEAAFVMPLAILCCVFFLRFFLLIGFQMNLQGAMESAAGQMAMTAGAAGVNTELDAAWNILLTRELALTELAGKSGLAEGGSAGLDFSSSYVDLDKQTIHLLASYRVAFPTGFAGTFFLGCTQVSARRLWTGTEGTSWKVSAPEEEEERTVYITENGVAYHLTMDCTYLSPSVRGVARTSLPIQRSEDGSYYYPCEYCHAAQTGGDTVYVTDYGNRYHSTLTCSRLARSVRAVKESEVGNRHPCSKCAAGRTGSK